MRAAFIRASFAIAAAAATFAESNIDPAHAVVTSEWIGELNWRPNSQSGASINQYYCSGFIYGANVGWINLGGGVPADKFQYKNNSAADFGVNVLPNGALRGFAYGANIGWINFGETGNPRVDWNTGRLEGTVWSANAGWISLDQNQQFVRIAFLPAAADSDNDGLADAWEIQKAGNLTELSGGADSDRDGQTDLEEYLAGTNPKDPADFLAVTISVSFDTASRTLTWPTKAGYLYKIDQRSSFTTYDSWDVLPGQPILGTGNSMSVQLPANSEGNLFYRVRAFPPLSTVD